MRSLLWGYFITVLCLAVSAGAVASHGGNTPEILGCQDPEKDQDLPVWHLRLVEEFEAETGVKWWPIVRQAVNDTVDSRIMLRWIHFAQQRSWLCDTPCEVSVAFARLALATSTSDLRFLSDAQSSLQAASPTWMDLALLSRYPVLQMLGRLQGFDAGLT
mmetsp:Transcript_3627/g.7534  ORF Transcript_3627/g.7534 Transcript_3627/m.7534 type:complete len:160 (+) Transcript_3627:44-523(+)